MNETPEPDLWVAYQTTDRRPWVDRLGNRHSYRTKRFSTPQAYLDAGCQWQPRTPEQVRKDGGY